MSSVKNVNMVFTTNTNTDNEYTHPKVVLKKATIKVKTPLKNELIVFSPSKNVMLSSPTNTLLTESYIYKSKNTDINKNVNKSVNGTLASIFKNIQVKQNCRSCGGGFK